MAQAQRTRLQVDERRAQLLELGLSLFAEKSYEELSIGDIAKAAGISKGLLYHYFPSKRDFYVAALKMAADRLIEETEFGAAAVTGEPDLASVRRGLDAYLRFVDQRASHYAFVLRGGMGNDAEAQAIVEETRTHYVDRMLEGLGRSDADARLRIAVRGFVGFVEAASLDWLDRRDLSREQLTELLLTVCVAAVTAAVGGEALPPAQRQ